MANVSSSNGIEKCPKLQFRDADGHLFPAWKQYRFDSLYKPVSEKNDLSYGVEHIISVANMYFKPDARISDPEYLRTYNVFKYGDIAFEGNKSKNYANGRFVENTIGDGIVSHVFNVLRPISPKHNLEYWKYAINNENVMGRILARCTKKTTMMTNLVTADFLEQEICCPIKLEQDKIAFFLSLIEKRLAAQEQLVDALKKYKRGLLQAIFSREVQLENSTCWERRLFSEIASLNKGKYSPKQDEVLPCIELEHLEQQTGQIIGYANSNEQNSVKSVFHKGDVLFGKLRPYLRKFALPEYDGVCSSEIWVFHPEHDINSTFLFYLIQSESFIAAANISSGTKMPRAEWSKVSNESFFIPELSEQKRIADLFGSIDKRIVNASRSANEMQSLKQGLLQQLFI